MGSSETVDQDAEICRVAIYYYVVMGLLSGQAGDFSMISFYLQSCHLGNGLTVSLWYLIEME